MAIRDILKAGTASVAMLTAVGAATAAHSADAPPSRLIYDGAAPNKNGVPIILAQVPLGGPGKMLTCYMLAYPPVPNDPTKIFYDSTVRASFYNPEGKQRDSRGNPYDSIHAGTDPQIVHQLTDALGRRTEGGSEIAAARTRVAGQKMFIEYLTTTINRAKYNAADICNDAAEKFQNVLNNEQHFAQMWQQTDAYRQSQAAQQPSLPPQQYSQYGSGSVQGRVSQAPIYRGRGHGLRNNFAVISGQRDSLGGYSSDYVDVLIADVGGDYESLQCVARFTFKNGKPRLDPYFKSTLNDRDYSYQNVNGPMIRSFQTPVIGSIVTNARIFEQGGRWIMRYDTATVRNYEQDGRGAPRINTPLTGMTPNQVCLKAFSAVKGARIEEPRYDRDRRGDNDGPRRGEGRWRFPNDGLRPGG